MAYVPDLPNDYRRKMMYRLVKKTEKGPGPKGMPVLVGSINLSGQFCIDSIMLHYHFILETQQLC